MPDRTTVRKDRLRVNVQLVDAETGNHLWAERFDKPVADLFEMQDKILSRLANALNVQLTEAEARRAERSLHPDAMDLFFQGEACLHKGLTPEQLTKARGFFERSLAVDPRSVRALIGLANVDMIVGIAMLTDDRAVVLSAAETNATKALSLASHAAEAHFVLGCIYIMTNRAAQGIAECEQALMLNPNMADAHAARGWAKFFMGRAADTEGHILEALRLSPRDTFANVWMNCLGRQRYNSALTPKPSIGYEEVSKPAAIFLSLIFIWLQPWACSARWTRPGLRQKWDSP